MDNKETKDVRLVLFQFLEKIYRVQAQYRCGRTTIEELDKAVSKIVDEYETKFTLV